MAQAQVEIGLRSGGNWASATALPLPIFDKILPTVQSPLSRVSFNFGIFTDVPIVESLSFISGIEYGEKHIFTSSEIPSIVLSPSLLGFFDATHIEVPLLLKFSYQLLIQPYLIAGVYFRKTITAYTTTVIRGFAQSTLTESNSLENIQSLEWGLQSGVGFSYEFMTHLSVFTDGRFLYGFTNNTKVMDWESSYTRELRFCLGLSYKF